MVQDLPISKPYPANEIDRLIEAKEVAVLCPFYLDLAPCGLTLNAMVDRMKSLGDTLMVATCKVYQANGSSWEDKLKGKVPRHSISQPNKNTR